MKWIINILLFFAVFSNVAGRVELIKETNTEMELVFHLPDYQSQLVEKGQKYYEYFETAEQTYYQEAGYPLLPYFSANVIIPDNDKMEIELGEVVYEEIKVSTILPAGNNEEPADIYNTEKWYPAVWADLSAPYIFRDVRGMTIRFNPFRYQASAGVVQIAKFIEIKVKSVGVSEQNTLQFKPFEKSPLFHSFQQEFFINYEESSSENEGEMILLCPESLESIVEPFVVWKNQKGMKTSVFSYPADTGTHWRDIRAFLERQYEISNLTYVMLVGDYNFIPSPNEQVSDWQYTCLQGDDLFPEILLGRLPVSNEAETELLLNKLIRYEKNPLSHQPNTTGVLLSSDFPESKRYNKRKEQNYELHRFLSGKDIADYINAGLSWLVTTDDYLNTDSLVESLVNAETFPFIISFLSSQEKQAEQAEKMVKAQYQMQGVGAISYVGFPEGNFGEQERQTKVAVDLFSKEKHLSAGMVLLKPLLASPFLLSQSKILESSFFFGDPSLSLQTKPVSELMVAHNNLVSNTDSFLTFTVRGKDGFLADAIVSISQNGVLKESKRTDKHGFVKIALSDTIQENRLLDVIVTAPNHIPYLGTVHVFEQENEEPVIPVIKAEIFPNPFYADGKQRSGYSNLLYEISERSMVRIAIYNSLGQLIKNVYQGEQAPGEYAFRWDGTDEFERKVASGTYLYLLEINHQVISKKMLLIK